MTSTRHYRPDGKPRCRAEKPAAEMLSTVWIRWRRDARCGRPCFVAFAPAAVARLDEAQPHWRLFCDFVQRDVVRPWDFQSARLDKLSRLFVAGRHPTDEIDLTEAETGAEPWAIAAE